MRRAGGPMRYRTREKTERVRLVADRSYSSATVQYRHALVSENCTFSW